MGEEVGTQGRRWEVGGRVDVPVERRSDAKGLGGWLFAGYEQSGRRKRTKMSTGG